MRNETIKYSFRVKLIVERKLAKRQMPFAIIYDNVYKINKINNGKINIKNKLCLNYKNFEKLVVKR
jgi:hypothetical protein